MSDKKYMPEISSISNAGTILTQACHANSYNAGWWFDPETGEDILKAAGKYAPYIIATKIALVHSEASEALEGDRCDKMDDKLPEYPMVVVELADVVLRAFDLAGKLGHDLGPIIAKKIEVNQKREDHKIENRVKKGGKKY